MPVRHRLDSDAVHRARTPESNPQRHKQERGLTVKEHFNGLSEVERGEQIAANTKALKLNLLSTRAALNVECDEHDADRGDWCWDLVVRAVCNERMRRGFAALGVVFRLGSKHIRPTPTTPTAAQRNDTAAHFRHRNRHPIGP